MIGDLISRVVKLFKDNRFWKTSTKLVLPPLRLLQSPNLIYIALVETRGNRALYRFTERSAITQKLIKRFAKKERKIPVLNSELLIDIINLILRKTWKKRMFQKHAESIKYYTQLNCKVCNFIDDHWFNVVWCAKKKL